MDVDENGIKENKHTLTTISTLSLSFSIDPSYSLSHFAHSKHHRSVSP
jgi:hypothetical protein